MAELEIDMEVGPEKKEAEKVRAAELEAKLLKEEETEAEQGRAAAAQ